VLAEGSRRAARPARTGYDHAPDGPRQAGHSAASRRSCAGPRDCQPCGRAASLTAHWGRAGPSPLPARPGRTAHRLAHRRWRRRRDRRGRCAAARAAS
jgi:hypothetical protein